MKLLPRLVLILLLGLYSAVVAADTDTDPRVRTTRLLFHAEGNPITPVPPAWSETARRGIAADQVKMYIAGVIDSAEGVDWCTQASGISPHEIDARLLDELRRHDDVELTVSAAAVIQAFLRTLYPCK